MKRTVDQFIQRHRLIQEGNTVLIAVSGGPDSIALLHYLLEKRMVWNLRLVALHGEHGLRGSDSVEDMTFVKAMCVEFGIECVTEKLNVKNYIDEHSCSVQEAARECRYYFFERMIARFKADVLATGHHGDDQIETMVMRQVRGAGSGLGGIPVTRSLGGGKLIRPFLNVSKDDILLYCEENGIPYRTDHSNEEDKYTRNRFRKQVLPFFKEENPNVHQRFQSQSEWLHEDDSYLTGLAEEKLSGVITERTKKSIMISVKAFLDMPIPLQRRAFHLILNYLSIDNIRVQALSIHRKVFIDLLVQANPSGHLDFPGDLFVERSYDVCLFSTERDTKETEGDKVDEQLPVPGMVTFKRGKIKASVQENDRAGAGSLWVFKSDPGHLPLPLTVRTRKNGDRVVPKGMTGTKKLKDLFIDKKVPRHLRDSWPVVTDREDRIIWVPGIVHTETGSALPKKDKMLYLECELDDDSFREVT
ncbi:tRNA lysidine(34) synthetase TilS [Bacillus sp. H-16]|uniref:tRNA lysidine(34) synthetase TilS n=1 Tax=Alteribacter salitolerans TaxID=2912333 RepID=UPI0019629658|nr:tRNA lysidine(34) synthetase TilS [Alteribacter salitolerans]MBM7097956.1 tRNA lysidine(34) synthetase TilS [Alteribacter salitolerans]